MLPTIAFVGFANSGKTTLLEEVVRELKACGYRVAVAKHTHHLVDLDQPGKDSWRMAQAGADAVVLGTPQGLTYFDYAGADVPLEQVAALLEGKVDFLLAEGYKDAAVPKVAVVRAEVTPALPCDPRDLIAAVTDADLPVDVPQFGFDQGPSVAHFLVRRFAHQGAFLHARVRYSSLFFSQ